MVNVVLLEDKIHSTGIKKKKICECLNITKTSFRYKMLHPQAFSVDDMLKISILLNLTSEERDNIFLVSNVT